MKALLTFDVDWASDIIIEPIINMLIIKKIPSLWFITHNTQLLDKMRKHNDIFELGIHPNFFNNSTQGKNEIEIIEYLLKIVPEAKCVRTHGLYQYSNLILDLSYRFGLRYDFSVFLPNCKIEPHEFRFNGKSIIRIPYNWEDDIAMFYDGGIAKSLEIASSFDKVVFDFHPALIALNSCNLSNYERAKKVEPNISLWNNSLVENNKNKSEIGISDVFNNLIQSNKSSIDFIKFKELIKL